MRAIKTPDRYSDLLLADVGGNLSTSHVRPYGHLPAAYAEVPNTIQLDQATLYFERTPDTVQTDHFDWGFRLTNLYEDLQKDGPRTRPSGLRRRAGSQQSHRPVPMKAGPEPLRVQPVEDHGEDHQQKGERSGFHRSAGCSRQAEPAR
jgi:hypothetical protein